MNGLAAECLVQTLHAKADTENGYLSLERPDEREGDTGVGGIFWPRADQDIVGRQRIDPVEVDLVRAAHNDIQVVSHEHLDEIVSEGVVIVDDQQFCQDLASKCEKATRTESGWPSPMT